MNRIFCSRMLAGFLSFIALIGATNASAVTYTSENRSIVSSGSPRTFVLAYPSSIPAGTALPLVFSYHDDGGTGASIRAALALESEAAAGAVFIYPNAPGGVFPTATQSGQAREQTFMLDVLAAMRTEFGVSAGRVYLAGFGRGGLLANILGCRLGAGIVRGIGSNAGGLSPDEIDAGVLDCAFPPSVLIWGTNDQVEPISPNGEGYRDVIKATQGCGVKFLPLPVQQCSAFNACKRGFSWCPIPNLPHAIWFGAAHAIWLSFDELLFANDFD